MADHEQPKKALVAEEPAVDVVDHGVIESDGDVWILEFGGIVRHINALKGLKYLSLLLQEPGLSIPAVVLEAEKTDHPEQARLNVTRAIHSVMKRLDDVHPSLADHLKATVRTGAKCCYRPDPRVPIRWTIRER